MKKKNYLCIDENLILKLLNMKKSLGIFSLAICLSMMVSVISCTTPTTQSNNSGYYVAAYIWPSCHNDSLGQAHLWADGEGEWEVIKKGNPRFEGHYQPKQPLWGYEHDNDPKVVER